jgi:charged multivesicular body protein 4
LQQFRFHKANQNCCELRTCFIDESTPRRRTKLEASIYKPVPDVCSRKMSFFKKVFGEKAKPAPTLPQAIRRLKLTQDVLLKRQAALEDKIKKEIATARKNASTNKKLALQAVQKKKRFERQLQQLDGALTTLEAQLEILESANTNTLAVASMEKASKALKATQKDL